ncbi:hypothetical protein GW916_06675 [bacterium]|nr:hypothetical protein [bacterium]
MQTKQHSKVLVYYGIFLIVAGIVGYLSNPEKAQTALFSGGLFGSISLALSWFVLKAQKWAVWASAIVMGLLTFVFTWRSYVGWSQVLEGNSEKTFAAALISTMLFASLMGLYSFGKNYLSRNQKAT